MRSGSRSTRPTRRTCARSTRLERWPGHRLARKSGCPSSPTMRCHPSWSADGSLLYHFSFRDGAFCPWVQRIDPATKRPMGPPRAVLHLHNPRLRASTGAAATERRPGRLLLLHRHRVHRQHLDARRIGATEFRSKATLSPAVSACRARAHDLLKDARGERPPKAGRSHGTSFRYPRQTCPDGNNSRPVRRADPARDGDRPDRSCVRQSPIKGGRLAAPTWISAPPVFGRPTRTGSTASVRVSRRRPCGSALWRVHSLALEIVFAREDPVPAVTGVLRSASASVWKPRTKEKLRGSIRSKVGPERDPGLGHRAECVTIAVAQRLRGQPLRHR